MRIRVPSASYRYSLRPAAAASVGSSAIRSALFSLARFQRFSNGGSLPSTPCTITDTGEGAAAEGEPLRKTTTVSPDGALSTDHWPGWFMENPCSFQVFQAGTVSDTTRVTTRTSWAWRPKERRRGARNRKRDEAAMGWIEGRCQGRHCWGNWQAHAQGNEHCAVGSSWPIERICLGSPKARGYVCLLKKSCSTLIPCVPCSSWSFSCSCAVRMLLPCGCG